MTFEEYRRLDGTAMAALVASGQTSAAELLDAALARAAAVNPAINAITIPMEHLARSRAAETLQGPLAGAPFLLKDLFQDHAGLRTTRGSKALRAVEVTPAQHGAIVARWLGAGIVPMGATNTPEFGSKPITEPEAWGPCRNPWNLDHTPGGSSGGSAAAVAAGIAPMAGANDGGGSIRLPSSMCGLFGLKPGRGVTPWGPPDDGSVHGAAVNHVITRSVRDSAAMLDAAAVRPPSEPYAEQAAREPGRLRIGFTVRSPLGQTGPDAIEATQDAARLLEQLGHSVEQAEPEIDGAALARDFLTVWFGQMAQMVEKTRAETGAGREGFDKDTLAMALFGRAAGPAPYAAARERWAGYADALRRFHATHDLYLTPSAAQPPARIGAYDTPGWQHLLMRAMEAAGLAGRALNLASTQRLVIASLAPVPFSQLANIAGVPAMSVPLHWTATGLPVGVQLVAPEGGEGRLLSLARQLEQARPWFDRTPPL